MRKRDPAGKREAILASAFRLFREKGYKGATMDEMVSLSGVSKGGIYWHFPSKEELFFALMEDWIEKLGHHYYALREAEIPYADKIRRFLHFPYRDSEETMWVISMEFWLLHLPEPHTAERMQSWMGRIHDMLRELLFEGIVRAEFKPLDIEELAYSFMGMMEGMAGYRILMNQSPLNRVGSLGLTLFLDGIKRQEGGLS